MASRRVAASSVDWLTMASRVPETQKQMFNAFKGKSDGYLRRVLSLPAEMPKINFTAYKARIAIPGMVEEFEKQYSAIQIPYPADSYSKQIDEIQKEVTVETETFIKESEGRIAKLQAELAEWQKMIPYDQMTMEEMVEAFPDKSVNVANPTLWPHTPEDQPGYVAKEGAEE
ncbi:ATP synthase subunit d, mitochondrial-like [Portunus trituberculatus]|uniref:ATP synthase subunit d, mitochondrial-like n=1 Tax=Portunus trituberculatus TaxID=210409 RepID=UPI001E1D0236|nr:ATP synthase subunit d, mitochondrial-like [Portunus trituberculatus]